MAGNLNIKNANGKTLTIQNPDTNNADIVIDGSKIASTVSPVFTGNPVAPTQAAGDNSTKIATTAFCTSQDLGVGQTWQNVLANRASGVTYTNSTGKPILITIAYANTATSGNLTPDLVIGGISILHQSFDGTSYGSNTIVAIVPNNTTYVYTIKSTQIIVKWSELR